MAKLFLFSLVAFFAAIRLASGGDGSSAPNRKMFRQSATFPHVFEAVSYLENGGPVPLRFGAPIVDCSQRTPPALTLAKKTDDKAEQKIDTAAVAQTAEKPEVVTTEAKSHVPATAEPNQEQPAAYPPPVSGPAALSPENPDFNRAPDEVLEFYKNPYNTPHSNQHLFDPIFEPAAVHTAPPSKATYRQRP